MTPEPPAERDWPCRSRRRLLATLGTAGAGVLAGCVTDDGTSGRDAAAGETNGDPATGTGSSTGRTATTGATRREADATSTATSAEHDDWRRVELTAVRDGERFTVDGFDDPVVLAPFATWCSKCRRQQEAFVPLREQLGDGVTVVSASVEGDVTAAKLEDVYLRHHEAFDWRFTVAPFALSRSLVARFGTVAVHAPSTPVVVACQGGPATLLTGGTPWTDIAATVRDCRGAVTHRSGDRR